MSASSSEVTRVLLVLLLILLYHLISICSQTLKSVDLCLIDLSLSKWVVLCWTVLLIDLEEVLNLLILSSVVDSLQLVLELHTLLNVLLGTPLHHVFLDINCLLSLL